MECINIINTYRKNNNNDNKNKYKTDLKFLKHNYSKMPTTKDIFDELEILHQKKNTLLKEYSQTKNLNLKFNKLKNNYRKFLHKNNER